MFKKYNLKSLSYTDILFFIALSNTILWKYIKVFLSRIPYIGIVSEPLSITIISILIILSIKKYIQKLKPIDYIFFISCLIIYILQYIIFPENILHLDQISSKFLIKTLPFYFVGRIIDYSRISKHITLLSILSIICFVIIYYILNASDDKTDIYHSGDMYSAYIIMPFIILIILDAFKTRNKISIIISISSYIILLSLGNRGAVLYTTIFTSICIMNQLNKKTITTRIMVFIVLIISIYLFLGVFIENIYMLFEELGVSTRIFDKLENDQLDTSGRDQITSYLLKELSYKTSGYGLTADRRFIVDSYAHNIFLELVFSFGYVIGGLIIILLVSTLLRAYINCRKKNNNLFYIAMICFGILPLMTSMSFLEYPYFFLLLGYTTQINNNKRLYLNKN